MADILATDPVPVRAESQIDSLKQLVADMEHGLVETLIILGGNPVFTSPADVPFALRQHPVTAFQLSCAALQNSVLSR